MGGFMDLIFGAMVAFMFTWFGLFTKRDDSDGMKAASVRFEFLKMFLLLTFVFTVISMFLSSL